MHSKSYKTLCILAQIVITFLGYAYTAECADSPVDKDFEPILIEAEKIVVDVLNGLSKQNKIRLDKLPFGKTFAPGLSMRNPKPTARIRMNGKMFHEPYEALITPQDLEGQSDKYCAGTFNATKFNFSPNIREGDVYVLLSCGPTPQFDCAPGCALEVRAGKYGGEYQTFGTIF